MTVLEAQVFLATKRATRGRPDKSWMEKKVEALKVLRDAGISTDIDKKSAESTPVVAEARNESEASVVALTDAEIRAAKEKAEADSALITKAFEALPVLNDFPW